MRLLHTRFLHPEDDVEPHAAEGDEAMTTDEASPTGRPAISVNLTDQDPSGRSVVVCLSASMGVTAGTGRC